MRQFSRFLARNGIERAPALPVPRDLDGRPGFYAPAFSDAGEVAAARQGELRLRVRLTTPTVDRQGDIIVPTGASLRHFINAPVLLWAHRHDLPPIGSVDVSTLRVAESGIDADVVFDAADPAAVFIYGKYQRRVMRTWSIGFIPLEWEVLRQEEGGRVTGYRITRWELLEVSAVPVPANPEALSRELAGVEPEGPLACVVAALKGALSRGGRDGAGADPGARRAAPEPGPWSALGLRTGAVSDALLRALAGRVNSLVAREIHRLRGGL
jgi:HK97 family phage prohead protease